MIRLAEPRSRRPTKNASLASQRGGKEVSCRIASDVCREVRISSEHEPTTSDEIRHKPLTVPISARDKPPVHDAMRCSSLFIQPLHSHRVVVHTPIYTQHILTFLTHQVHSLTPEDRPSRAHRLSSSAFLPHHPLPSPPPSPSPPHPPSSAPPAPTSPPPVPALPPHPS